MKDIAIIGASYLQVPLIEKAKEMGLITHVFAWEAGDPGEKAADHFYPISITEKEKILEKCREIGISGITSISSDLAAVTVNFVADALHLAGNSPQCALFSTNKHEMRMAFERGGDPSVKSILVKDTDDLKDISLSYPVIVKPLDRSGSRGITRLSDEKGLSAAIERAKEEGFIKAALVEEYARGEEYSVECISYHGTHQFLAMTEKFTTGSPNFVETAHLEPAEVSDEMRKKVMDTVFHALDTLMIRDSASHSEIRIDDEGNIKIIEIGGRMGGDMIGSDLVYLSTGYDFLKAVIDVSLSTSPAPFVHSKDEASAIRYIFSEEDKEALERLLKEHPEYLVRKDIHEITGDLVTDSSERYGYFLMKGPS
nr:ATP-grasp domain-containing protein [Lachnospiraceae bacterium]